MKSISRLDEWSLKYLEHETKLPLNKQTLIATILQENGELLCSPAVKCKKTFMQSAVFRSVSQLVMHECE